MNRWMTIIERGKVKVVKADGTKGGEKTFKSWDAAQQYCQAKNAEA